MTFTSLTSAKYRWAWPHYVFLACCAFSCSEGQLSRVPRELQNVPELAVLKSIRLPASVRDLGRVRPGAKMTDFGLEERAGDADIRFIASRPGQSSEPVDSGAIVPILESARDLSSDDSATKAWTSASENITRALNVEPACWTPRRTAYRIRLARWPIPGGAVYLRQQYRDSVQTGGAWRVVPSAITVGVSVDSAAVAPLFASAGAVRCE
jgi:hypothetical protein